jgi:hypothetical protein
MGLLIFPQQMLPAGPGVPAFLADRAPRRPAWKPERFLMAPTAPVLAALYFVLSLQ